MWVWICNWQACQHQAYSISIRCLDHHSQTDLVAVVIRPSAAAAPGAGVPGTYATSHPPLNPIHTYIHTQKPQSTTL